MIWRFLQHLIPEEPVWENCVEILASLSENH